MTILKAVYGSNVNVLFSSVSTLHLLINKLLFINKLVFVSLLVKILSVIVLPFISENNKVLSDNVLYNRDNNACILCVNRRRLMDTEETTERQARRFRLLTLSDRFATKRQSLVGLPRIHPGLMV